MKGFVEYVGKWRQFIANDKKRVRRKDWQMTGAFPFGARMRPMTLSFFSRGSFPYGNLGCKCCSLSYPGCVVSLTRIWHETISYSCRLYNGSRILYAHCFHYNIAKWDSLRENSFVWRTRIIYARGNVAVTNCIEISIIKEITQISIYYNVIFEQKMYKV